MIVPILARGYSDMLYKFSGERKGGVWKRGVCQWALLQPRMTYKTDKCYSWPLMVGLLCGVAPSGRFIVQLGPHVEVSRYEWPMDMTKECQTLLV